MSKEKPLSQKPTFETEIDESLNITQNSGSLTKDLEAQPDTTAHTESAESLHEERDADAIHRTEIPYSFFLKWEIYVITGAVSFLAFFSSISVPIYLPALPQLEEDFNVSTELINLTVVIYTLFQGLAPSVWSPLADRFGRRPVYLACCVVYIGANIGLALATNYGMIMGFRALQAMGMASTVAIGSGVVGDLTKRENRGSYIAMFSGITLVGSAVGPLIGAGLIKAFGWRSVFWFLTIACGVALVFVIVAVPETCRALVGNGSVRPVNAINQAPVMNLRGAIKPELKQISIQEGRARGIMEPFKKVSQLATWRLCAHLTTLLLLVPCGLHYACWFMLMTAQSSLLTEKYNFSTISLGLSYLGGGLGSVAGSLLSGRIMDAAYRTHVRKYKETWAQEHGDEPVDMDDFDIVSARLSTFPYPSAFLMASTLIFGWTIEYHVHWAVPVVMMAFVSFSAVFLINLASCLLVDLHPNESSSATAALNLVRCVLAAAGIAAIDKMIASLGAGGAFTLMSGIVFASWACFIILFRRGRNEIQNKKKKKSEN